MRKFFKKVVPTILATTLIFSNVPFTVNASTSYKRLNRSYCMGEAIKWAKKIAADDTHGYSQANRWGPDYDCSSFLIQALKEGGFYVGGATYTGNMKANLTQYDFEWIPWSKIGSTSDLKVGDILLNEIYHTEMYIGNNQNIGAHDDEDRMQGDSSGREISISNYWNDNWDGVLRVKGDATFTLRASEYTYKGAEHYPTETVKLDGKTLIKGTDYTTSYKNNKDVNNNGKVTIEGINTYKGTMTRGFKVVPLDISQKATVTLSPTSYPFDGQAKQPDVTVKVNNITLTKDKDYTVTYKDNINPGQASVIVKGKGNYTGSKTATFTINAQPISSASVKLAYTTCTYDGTEKKPAPTVTLNGNILTLDEDYTVEYKDNKYPGTAQVIITGKEAFSGSKTATFTINKASIANATITLNKTSYIYDGKAKCPTPTVKMDGNQLSTGSDFTIKYENNVNVGTAKVIITGNGYFTGTKTAEFKILNNNIDIANATIKLDKTSYLYNGKAKEPTVTVEINGYILTKDQDYTVVYKNNINTGQASVIVNGIGNYTGSKTVGFIIIGSITNATITLNKTSYIYDGKAKCPTPTVKIGGKQINIGSEFTIKYENNVNVGTAKVIITGRGYFTGTKTAECKILDKKFDIANASVKLAYTTCTYDGTEKTPVPTVTLNGKILKNTENYTISYKNNIKAGTAQVVIEGKDDYAGKKIITFTINKADAMKATVELSSESFQYDGKAKEPDVTVKLNSKPLTKDTDYTVVYKNNVNIGIAQVVITFIGNYTGTITKTYTIKGSIESADVVLSKKIYSYDGKAKTPTATVKLYSKPLIKDTDYTVEYKNNVNIGTAGVVIKGKGNYQGTKTINFTIEMNGIYRIACASNTNFGLDIESYDTINHANVILWGDNGGNNQKFQVKPVGKGYYTIMALHSGRYIDVDNASKKVGANIQQYDGNNTSAQSWKLKVNSDGSYTLESKLGLVMDISDGKIANGSNIQTYTSNDTNAQKFKFIPTTKNYIGYDEYAGGKSGTGKVVAKGFDVSQWQENNFDFKSMKNNGYTYVILRCGHSEPNENNEYKGSEDIYFEHNYKAAKEAGLDVGVYYYSSASNEQEASYDASLCLDYIKNKKFEYPVYLDFEDDRSYSGDGNRAKGICMAFLDKLAASGYLVGLYGQASWIDENWSDCWVPTSEICQKYECWIAHFGANSAQYQSRYGMHQYNGTGLDLDNCFKDYPSIVKKYGFNGYPKNS